jgi:hypothetical protein
MQMDRHVVQGEASTYKQREGDKGAGCLVARCARGGVLWDVLLRAVHAVACYGMAEHCCFLQSWGRAQVQQP